MTIKQFCVACGTEKVSIRAVGFSEATGEPVRFSGKCPNTKCTIGCADNGGHEFEKPEEKYGCSCRQWFGHSTSCQMCGKEWPECRRCGKEDINCVPGI